MDTVKDKKISTENAVGKNAQLNELDIQGTVELDVAQSLVGDKIKLGFQTLTVSDGAVEADFKRAFSVFEKETRNNFEKACSHLIWFCTLIKEFAYLQQCPIKEACEHAVGNGWTTLSLSRLQYMMGKFRKVPEEFKGYRITFSTFESLSSLPEPSDENKGVFIKEVTRVLKQIHEQKITNEDGRLRIKEIKDKYSSHSDEQKLKSANEVMREMINLAYHAFQMIPDEKFEGYTIDGINVPPSYYHEQYRSLEDSAINLNIIDPNGPNNLTHPTGRALKKYITE